MSFALRQEVCVSLKNVKSVGIASVEQVYLATTQAIMIFFAKLMDVCFADHGEAETAASQAGLSHLKRLKRGQAARLSTRISTRRSVSFADELGLQQQSQADTAADGEIIGLLRVPSKFIAMT